MSIHNYIFDRVERNFIFLNKTGILSSVRILNKFSKSYIYGIQNKKQTSFNVSAAVFFKKLRVTFENCLFTFYTKSFTIS